jgi:ribonucleoside-diphosphate reductase alpha subunit
MHKGMSNTVEMRVQKRNGEMEAVSFDKVTARIRGACDGLSVNATMIAQKVLGSIIDGIKTSELDELTCVTAVAYVTEHPDYGVLASRIAVSNHHKNTPTTFLEVAQRLAAVKNKRGETQPAVSDKLTAILALHHAEIEAKLDYNRDYLFDYFGFKTLEKSYLLRDEHRKVLERPQHMWMRTALELWPDNLEKAFETYDAMSQKLYTHATPTLFNSCTPKPQLSSCFLLAMKEDSIAGIYDTLKDCATISKHSGGIGLHIHNVRAKGSIIHGTNGVSNGIVPMLRVFNNTACYVDQCFTPDTLVVSDKGNKPISEFMEGDMVLTSTGEFKKVLKCISHWHTGDLCIINGVRVTDTHPLLAIKNDGRSIEVVTKIVKPEYIEVKELCVGDILCSRFGDNWTYKTIETIGETTYEGPIFDFRIEEPHDYTIANFGLAHNGGGKRNGSFAIYLEPWHADIGDFIRMKMNTGSEDEKARDLFYALWVPDLFMERVIANGDWTLFCPAEAPGLSDCYGDEFKALYERYEAEGKGRKTVKAQKIWFEILESQIETGTPYLVYKDACNRKSNQKNLGVIKSSNLCSEIIEYSAPDETAVCNLASMALPAFITNGQFDFAAFRKTVALATTNLNRVIDVNFYPTPETLKSNMRHRPVGLGIQGLADVFALLKMSWESPEAFALNKQIFAHMYYAALQQSMLLAKADGPYETFKGSPASKGELQFDLWQVDPVTSPELDWAQLKQDIQTHGLRNSLLVAPMPTASTSQILGYNECIEPFTSNIYTRRTLAGEFILVNKYLISDLLALGLWSPELKNKIIGNGGSVQGIAEIPAQTQALYKTVWEMKQKTLIDMAAQRGAYVCQSQSLNLYVADPDFRKLTSMHVYAWQQGLKTGIYYLRTKSVVKAQQFTVEPVQQVSQPAKKEEECVMCSA